MNTRFRLIAIRLSVVSLACMTLSGCGRKRSDRGPWEYAEVGASSEYTQAGSIGLSVQQAPAQTDSDMYFETGDSRITGDGYADLMKKMGAKDVKQDCSTALLNFLDREGWELVSYTNNINREVEITPQTSQFGTVSNATYEHATQNYVWILRRVR